MDEFVKKLIGRLEEVSYNHFDLKLSDAKEIVNQLAEEYNNSNDSMEIQIAKNYAKWLTKCGVNVTEKWLTATEQEYALNKAYIRGRQDEIDKFAEWQNEHNGGWIPCSERLPEVEAVVLLSLRSLDVYTGFRANTEGCFYVEGEGYVEFENVLAWQPLPEPYRQKEVKKDGNSKN